MSTFFNREPVSAEIVRLDPTDFSAVTARPEFVLKGKKFHDVTGQLREGTLTSCGSVHVRFSENADGTDFSETWSDGKNYIGFAVAQVAPSAKECYTWEHVEAYLAIELQEKSVEITENGTTEVLPDAGYALSKVTVNTNVASGGGGEQPTLFAPFLTVKDTNELKNATFTVAANEQNGGFDVSIALRVNGEIVENPYTATEVGTYTVEAIASAENFADGVNTQIVEVYEMPTYSEGLTYSSMNYFDYYEYVMVVQNKSCTDVNLRIAPTYNGEPVVGIISCGYETMESVEIPDSIKYLGSSAFSGSKNLLSIDLPDGLLEIWGGAFSNCDKLVSIKIPKSVNKIKENAFTYCDMLQYLDFSDHESVPVLEGANGFYNGKAYYECRVPAALYDEWIAATNWSKIATAGKIVAV